MKNTSQNPFFNSRHHCPICNSPHFQNLLKIPYNDRELSCYLIKFYGVQGSIDLEYLIDSTFSLCKCSNCKGIFQEFIPNDFLMEKLYEEWISPEKALILHKQKAANSPLIDNYIKEIKNIQETFFHLQKNINVLDFGMGWGTWATTARDFGWSVYGVELSKSRIEYAESKRIKIINLPSNTIKFDFINTEQVFEHLPEPLETLKNLKEHLSKNGIIKISVPTANNIQQRLKKMDWEEPKGSKFSLNPVAPLEHINFYKKESLLEMAKIAGFKEVKMPLKIQYKNISWEGNYKKILKKVIAPVRLNIFNDLNYVFFKSI